MDPRIEQKLQELRLKEESENLLKVRVKKACANLTQFLIENDDGIKEIFRLNGAEFLNFLTLRSEKRLLCYSPAKRFHLRSFAHSTEGSDSKVVHDIDVEFKTLERLYGYFVETEWGTHSPEQLLDLFANAFDSDSDFHEA